MFMVLSSLTKKLMQTYIVIVSGTILNVSTVHEWHLTPHMMLSIETSIRRTPCIKVARYSFSGSIPPKFEHKLRRHKQSFGKIAITVVLDKDGNLL